MDNGWIWVLHIISWTHSSRCDPAAPRRREWWCPPDHLRMDLRSWWSWCSGIKWMIFCCPQIILGYQILTMKIGENWGIKWIKAVMPQNCLVIEKKDDKPLDFCGGSYFQTKPCSKMLRILYRGELRETTKEDPRRVHGGCVIFFGPWVLKGTQTLEKPITGNLVLSKENSPGTNSETPGTLDQEPGTQNAPAMAGACGCEKWTQPYGNIRF